MAKLTGKLSLVRLIIPQMENMSSSQVNSKLSCLVSGQMFSAIGALDSRTVSSRWAVTLCDLSAYKENCKAHWDDLFLHTFCLRNIQSRHLRNISMLHWGLWAGNH